LSCLLSGIGWENAWKLGASIKRWKALRRSEVPLGALLGFGCCGAADLLGEGRWWFVRVLVVCIGLDRRGADLP